MPQALASNTRGSRTLVPEGPRQDMKSCVTLLVALTWNGEPIPDEERVELTLCRLDEAIEIRVDAPYHGDPAPPGPEGSFDGLWDFEVVELFIAGEPTAQTSEGEVPYTEIELSPHGHYLVLRFAGVRRDVERGLELDFEATVEGARWTGGARLPLSYLPAQPWTANAYAILGTGSERRFLAMEPTLGTAPDFHRPEVFRPLWP